MRDLAKETEEIIFSFREVFNTDQGKKVLEYLERECLENDIVGVKTHEQYAYIQGKRDLLLVMKKLINAEYDKIKVYINKVKKEKTNGSI